MSKITDVIFTDTGKNKLSMHLLSNDNTIYCLKYKPSQKWICSLLLQPDILYDYYVGKVDSSTYVIKIRNSGDWEVTMYFYDDDVHNSNSGIWYSIKQNRSLFNNH